MFWVILILTLLLAVTLIVVVLLQPSKGGGITAAFGGIGGSLGSTFGQRRTLEFLGKATTWTAALIALLCILANIFFLPTSGGKQKLVTEGESSAGAGATPQLQMPSSGAPATGGQQPQSGQAAPAQGGQNANAQQQGANAAGKPANTTQKPAPAPPAGK